MGMGMGMWVRSPRSRSYRQVWTHWRGCWEPDSACGASEGPSGTTFLIIIFSEKSVFPFFARSFYGCFQCLLLKWSWWCLFAISASQKADTGGLWLWSWPGQHLNSSFKKKRTTQQRPWGLISVCGWLCFFSCSFSGLPRFLYVSQCNDVRPWFFWVARSFLLSCNSSSPWWSLGII